MTKGARGPRYNGPMMALLAEWDDWAFWKGVAKRSPGTAWFLRVRLRKLMADCLGECWVVVYEPDDTLNSRWATVQAARDFIADKPGWYFAIDADVSSDEGPGDV